MNILVITPFYKHDKNIASVRWTNISTRLAKRHNVIVVTQPNDDMDMKTTIQKDDDGVLVARINQKTAYEKLAVRFLGGATGDDWQTTSTNDNVTNNTNEGIVRKIKNYVLFASMKQKARSYAKQIQNKVIPKYTKIDIVISSACPFIEMLFGYELKKRLCCKWISDFRDLPFVDTTTHDSRIMKKIMCKCLAFTDAVTTTAKRGREYILQEIVADENKIKVISNGFSMSDARESIYTNDKKLHIVHTGSLYGGTRKADIFFKATLMARQNNPEFSYILECAGGNNESLLDTAKKYGEELYVDNRGFIPRQEALDMQAKADILLALVFNRPGTFVAKMFEYVLNQKPVICVTCGQEKNSEETEFVRETNIGIAVEEAEDDAVFNLTNYLLQQFDLKCQNKLLYFKPNKQKLIEFDHDNILQKFESLFDTI